jgi:hypothetical protein
VVTGVGSKLGGVMFEVFGVRFLRGVEGGPHVIAENEWTTSGLFIWTALIKHDFILTHQGSHDYVL